MQQHFQRPFTVKVVFLEVGTQEKNKVVYNLHGHWCQQHEQTSQKLLRVALFLYILLSMLNSSLKGFFFQSLILEATGACRMSWSNFEKKSSSEKVRGQHAKFGVLVNTLKPFDTTFIIIMRNYNFYWQKHEQTSQENVTSGSFLVFARIDFVLSFLGGENTINHLGPNRLSRTVDGGRPAQCKINVQFLWAGYRKIPKRRDLKCCRKANRNPEWWGDFSQL